MTNLYIHRNLNRKCWSVLLRGRLKEHRREIILQNVEFRVRPGGHRRSLREGRRNVHAFAVGERERSKDLTRKRSLLVRYDRKKGQFVTRDGRQVINARFAHFATDGVVRTYHPRFKDEEN